MKKLIVFAITASCLTALGHADPLRMFVTDNNGGSVKMYDGVTGAFISNFVAPGSGGLLHPSGIRFGPDGNLYVGSVGTGSVKRYDGTTGAYLGDFATGPGMENPLEITFGPDGNLYVGTHGSGNQIKRFNGVTGAFMGDFLTGTAMSSPYQILFHNDGLAYVSMYASGSIDRFNATTGAFVDVFATGLSNPTGIIFSSDGGLLVSSANGHVVKFAGGTGALIGNFITQDGTNVMSNPGDLHFGPNNDLFVTHGVTDTVKRFSSTATNTFLGDFFPSGSGGIDYQADFIFNQDFGPGPCPVPEPSTIVPLLLGGVLLTRRLRRK